MRAAIRSFLVLLCLGASAVNAGADELRLKNGDRLTGELVKLDAGTVTFKTLYGGEIPIKWSEVLAITTERPLVVTVATAPARMLTLAARAEGRVALREAGVDVSEVALADVVSIAPPTPPLVLSGGANTGLLWTEGNTDVSSIHVDALLTAKRPSDRYTFDAFVNRATDRGIETARNASGSARYDRFLSKRVFFDANAIFANDKFRDLRLRTALGAGIGYQVWQTPRGQFSLDGGLGYVRQNFTAAPDVDYAAVREAAKLDVTIVPARVDAFHHQDLYIGITGDDQLFFRMQNGLRMAMAARVVATAQFNLDYDRSPSPGRRNTDRSTAITIGYKF